MGTNEGAPTKITVTGKSSMYVATALPLMIMFIDCFGCHFMVFFVVNSYILKSVARLVFCLLSTVLYISNSSSV